LLYRLIAEHLETFLAESREKHDRPLPTYGWWSAFAARARSPARVPCEVSAFIYIASSSPRLCLAHWFTLIPTLEKVLTCVLLTLDQRLA